MKTVKINMNVYNGISEKNVGRKFEQYFAQVVNGTLTTNNTKGRDVVAPNGKVIECKDCSVNRAGLGNEYMCKGHKSLSTAIDRYHSIGKASIYAVKTSPIDYLVMTPDEFAEWVRPRLQLSYSSQSGEKRETVLKFRKYPRSAKKNMELVEKGWTL